MKKAEQPQALRSNNPNAEVDDKVEYNGESYRVITANESSDEVQIVRKRTLSRETLKVKRADVAIIKKRLLKDFELQAKEANNIWNN
jgi:hypothetical protein